MYLIGPQQLIGLFGNDTITACNRLHFWIIGNRDLKSTNIFKNKQHKTHFNRRFLQQIEIL